MSDAITEKVRKLLRLAKSANTAESASALAKAMEMAARHQIDVHTLADDAEIAKLVTRYFRCGGKRIAREWREAMGVARKFFNVTTCILRGEGKVAFIGTETDVQIADYVTGFLVRACRMELEKFAAGEKKRRRTMTANKRQLHLCVLRRHLVAAQAAARDADPDADRPGACAEGCRPGPRCSHGRRHRPNEDGHGAGHPAQHEGHAVCRL
jgi:hypothetical protein